MFQIRFQSLIKLCIATYATVVAGHIVGVVLAYGNPDVEKGIYFIRDMFYFGHEKSITALFSAFLFILLGLLFRQIGTHDSINMKQWNLIGYVAVFLACDEWFAIHDAALNIYGRGLFGIPIWVWVYGSLAGFLFVSLIPFLKRISPFLMKWLIVSGVIFISGSGIMEVVTYSYNNTSSLLHNIGWFFEDGLEMAGVLTMIIAASSWLKSKKQSYFFIKPGLAYFIGVVGFGDLIVSYWIELTK